MILYINHFYIPTCSHTMCLLTLCGLIVFSHLYFFIFIDWKYSNLMAQDLVFYLNKHQMYFYIIKNVNCSSDSQIPRKE